MTVLEVSDNTIDFLFFDTFEVEISIKPFGLKYYSNNSSSTLFRDIGYGWKGFNASLVLKYF